MINASTSKAGKSTSSAIAENIISGKPESSTNKVPSGAKVFSSFQVGKQHPKEEEYLAFTRYIYNLPEESGETFSVLGTTNRVYAKPGLQELSQLPTQLFNSVKNYAQGDGIYCRFFSISMESKDLQEYYPTINYISVEKIKDFNVKVTGVDKKLPHLNKKWIQTRRALGIKALYFILKRNKILDIELHRLEATEET
ncbi:hypothetical protein H5410_002211 [Solanum commersonii]|uniref:Uncharacterized protein n=1 Tax=Solanum commersonii TaxID=4109 RepID=A0A9J6B188_SOLCO|nr:hypothetical protein H5410_002211 [Solanum commersonii]